MSLGKASVMLREAEISFVSSKRHWIAPELAINKVADITRGNNGTTPDGTSRPQSGGGNDGNPNAPNPG